jgi:hypothetical protein
VKKPTFTFKFLLFIVMGLLLFQVRPQIALALTSGDFNYTLNGNNATITGYTGSAGLITIPATIDGHPVIRIGNRAFQQKVNLISVNIPNSVTNIGLGAFWGCSNLNEAKFLGNAPAMEKEVFDGSASGFKVFYFYGKTGFTNPWNGYPTQPLLAVPASVKAASTGYNSVKISWNLISGASGYEVYRAASTTGSYTKVSTTTATSYNNTGLTTNSTYYYKVRAYKTVGTTKVYSSYSTVVSAKPVLSAPASIKAVSFSYNIIGTNWSTVSGAKGYEVYRATSAAGTYTKIATTTVPGYYNTGLTTNRTYYYKVRAYRLVGTKKVYSNYSSVVSAKPIPATPFQLKASRINSESIRLTWIGVTGANGYEVYRATSRTGTYSFLKSTTNQYYIDPDLKTGKTYYYKVRSYRTVGKTKVYSGWTTIVYAKL